MMEDENKASISKTIANLLMSLIVLMIGVALTIILIVGVVWVSGFAGGFLLDTIRHGFETGKSLL